MSGTPGRAEAGVIFDLDGVLLDSEELHYRAYSEVLAQFGVQVSREEYAVHWIGEGTGPEYAVHTYRLPITAADLRRQKAPLYRKLLESSVSLMPGARAAVDRLAPHFRLAIATNSSRADVHWVLARFGLKEAFQAVIAREDYQHAKPAPDAYLAARAALELPAERCLVLEDSPRGVRAAQAAGLAVVAVPNAFTACCTFPEGTERATSLDVVTPEFVRAHLRSS